jgi:hypothetical protein
VLQLAANASGTGELLATWENPLPFERNGLVRSFVITAQRVDGPYSDPQAQTVFNATAT